MSRRKFVDIGLNLRNFSVDILEKLLSFLKGLGYSGFSTRLIVQCGEDLGKVLEIRDVLRSVSERVGLEYISRVDIVSNRKGFIKLCLRSIRRSFELVAIGTSSLEVARFAARDRRVDIVYFTSGSRRLLDDVECRMLSEGGKLLELSLSKLLLDISKYFATYRYVVEMCSEYGVNIVFTSGASSVHELRAPRELASVLVALGLPVERALDAVSDIVWKVVEVNRKKLRGIIVAEGVEVVGKEKEEKVRSSEGTE
ncbi:MAG: hypothetical protein DRJ40_02420 [Thermoprotei archaeon]|nr:MAG: hypothetical protein DRJ40_02420 [Thermoprotei archaeon]